LGPGKVRERNDPGQSGARVGRESQRKVGSVLFAVSVVVSLLIIVLFAYLISRTGRGEVAAIRSDAVANDDAWKAYHDALENDKKRDSQPLF